MKQKELVKQLYQACLAHDRAKQQQLLVLEFQKVFHHRERAKPFNPRWSVIR